jgi:hypothetical protein
LEPSKFLVDYFQFCSGLPTAISKLSVADFQKHFQKHFKKSFECDDSLVLVDIDDLFMLPACFYEHKPDVGKQL